MRLTNFFDDFGQRARINKVLLAESVDACVGFRIRCLPGRLRRHRLRVQSLVRRSERFLLRLAIVCEISWCLADGERALVPHLGGLRTPRSTPLAPTASMSESTSVARVCCSGAAAPVPSGLYEDDYQHSRNSDVVVTR